MGYIDQVNQNLINKQKADAYDNAINTEKLNSAVQMGVRDELARRAVEAQAAKEQGLFSSFIDDLKNRLSNYDWMRNETPEQSRMRGPDWYKYVNEDTYQ